MHARTWLPLAVAALAACSTGAPADSPLSAGAARSAGEGAEASGSAHVDLRAARAELLAADRHFARLAATVAMVDAVPAMLAEDAVYLHLGALLRSREEVRAALAAAPVYATARLHWTAVRADVSADGRHGYTFGFVDLERPGLPTLPAKYIAYWERQADGTWKVAAYNRAGRPAGEVSLTPPPGFESPDAPRSRFFPGTRAPDAEAMVRAADRAFSARAQEDSVSHAFAAFAAPDGATTGGTPDFTWGPAAIGAGGGAPGSLVWAPVAAGAAESGDLGFTTGLADVRVWEGGAWKTVRQTRYLSIWKRQPTGEWRYVIDG